jgi:hypothetical protein
MWSLKALLFFAILLLSGPAILPATTEAAFGQQCPNGQCPP